MFYDVRLYKINIEDEQINLTDVSSVIVKTKKEKESAREIFTKKRIKIYSKEKGKFIDKKSAKIDPEEIVEEENDLYNSSYCILDSDLIKANMATEQSVMAYTYGFKKTTFSNYIEEKTQVDEYLKKQDNKIKTMVKNIHKK